MTERTVTATSEVPAPTRYIGKGPIMTVARTGSPGIVHVVKGAVSGSVIESDVVVAPKASVVRRTTPRPKGKVVALTFDDGPWPVSTLAIVRILQKEKVRATFFMLGGSAGRRPAIARRVAAAGMLVGSHSLGHKDLTKVPRPIVRREIVFGVRRVQRVTHQEQRWFRPPYGAVDAAVLSEVRADHLLMAGWTIDSRDWARPGAAKIVRNVVGSVRPGSIILMHDGGGERSQTVRALPYLIHQLKRRGYTFVTLDELADQSRWARAEHRSSGPFAPFASPGSG